MACYQFANDDGDQWGSCEIFHADENHVRAHWLIPGSETDDDGPRYGCGSGPGDDEGTNDPAELAGWYWQAGFPGCLPDGDPMGPFDTEQEAMADAGVAQ